MFFEDLQKKLYPRKFPLYSTKLCLQYSSSVNVKIAEWGEGPYWTLANVGTRDVAALLLLHTSCIPFYCMKPCKMKALSALFSVAHMDTKKEPNL